MLQTDSGAPLALTGGMWALNARSEVTNVLGDYAEYWQPWADVVDGNGLPKQLGYLEKFDLSLPPADGGQSTRALALRDTLSLSASPPAKCAT